MEIGPTRAQATLVFHSLRCSGSTATTFSAAVNMTGEWPKRGDLPFRKPSRNDYAAPLASDGLTRSVSMMDGFMLAGSALADEAMKDDIRRHDLIYPMLFCYRHGIELGLKWLVTQYGPPVNITPSDISEIHDLWDLWDSCVKINRAYGGDENEFLIVEKSVKQFHDWDKAGTSFRYATRTNGAEVKFQYQGIDVANLKEVMSRIGTFFTGADGYFSEAARG